MEQATQRDSNLPMPVHGAGWLKLLALLATLFVVGVLFIAGSHLPQFGASLLGEILRDLGLAFSISVVIALIIELSLSRHTFLRGLDAIMQRTVPSDVWEDFRQHVITQPFMRKDWSVTMAMGKPSDDGSCISTTSIKYTVIALQDALSTNVQFELDSHRAPPGATQRYTRAKIDTSEYANPEELAQANLLSSDGLALMLPVKLARQNDNLPVELEFTELIRCPDTIPWWMSRVTRSVKLTIEGLPESWNVEVKTFHPAPHQLVRRNGANEWTFTGIMLPGQGIEIRMRSTR